MPAAISHASLYVWIALGIALVLGWVVLRIVLRLTMRMFAVGCVGLLVLAAIVFAVAYFSR